jgi:lactonase
MMVVNTIIAEPWVKVTNDPNISLEGLAFDREGNLYVCSIYTGDIWKITPDKKVTTIPKDPRITECASIDIHRDGRFFLCTLGAGKIVSIHPDGTGYAEIVTKLPDGMPCVPDDGVFDSHGNFYFNNIIGNFADPTGGVYRLSADLKTVVLVQGNLIGPNGICITDGFEGKEKRILVSEWGGNRYIRMDLQKDGVTPLLGGMGLQPVGYAHGFGLGSNIIDESGHWYVCSWMGGRIFIIDTSKNFYEPIAQVLVPRREQGINRETTSVTIRPGTDEGYMTADSRPDFTGVTGEGAWIMRFKALGKALTPYSHQ